MKLTNKETLAQRIVKEFTFEDEHGNNIIIEKWIDDREGFEDQDQTVISGNKYYNALSDQEKDEIDDIIRDNF